MAHPPAGRPEKYHDRFEPAELIHEFIEHRFSRSKQERRQVANDEALVTFLVLLAERPGERIVPDS